MSVITDASVRNDGLHCGAITILPKYQKPREGN